MTIDASPPSRRPAYLRVARLSLLILLSLYLFLLSLELIKGGARSLLDWFPQNAVHTSRGALGMGWLFSCIVLSGSPVAATALAFLDSEILDPLRSFSMVIGSRLGASFVVLVVGLAYDLQARRDKGGVYVGALALITTATVYVPAFFLGYALLDGGWLEGLRFGIPGWLKSPLDWALDRAVCELQGTLPEWGEALLGVA
ncbi:MAG: hypothetical protein HY721_30075, partial [Planctomycetes bacterium]|nr:hypothetical protein [Planctomycetota bacterium]